MDAEDDKVKRLPIRFKHPPKADGRVLERVPLRECYHDGPYIVDDSLAEVTCGKCKEKLNPMWVLGRLAAKENRFHEFAARYQDETKRLAERSRTKCEYCGKTTRISRR